MATSIPLRSLRQAASSLLAPEEEQPDGPPRILRPIVESAAEAYIWCRSALAGTPPSARTANARVRATVATASTQAQSASLALACFGWLAKEWNPIYIAPRGGHKLARERPMRQRNRSGRSMRQLAADWGMAHYRSSAVGITAFETLLACGAVRKEAEGYFLATTIADARARINAASASEGGRS